ncbi:MAG: tetratricopeptide repeat protein [Bacteroidetes bacterium]|nr:MAG: tetratricopeptide repeat protein [Bacteroidota bacterium]
MMKETRLKYIFYISAAILLLLMLLASSDAGITCDEVLHYNHSVTVYNYFASHGTDHSALNTPVSNLKYYGQSYDNLVTMMIKWFGIENVYGFRHVMSTLAGWIVILLTALFAVWLTSFRAGILVLILFGLSPTFMGHAQNNLKDIPFALGYISSTFFTIKFLISGKKVSSPTIILLTASIAFSISIRAGGLLLISYLFLFFIIFYLVKYLRDKHLDSSEIRTKFIWITGISVVSWGLSILLWPYALQSPVKNVLESYHVMAHFPSTFRQVFEGKVEWSDYMPWYYLLKSMAITIPFIILTGLVLFIFSFRMKLIKEKVLLYGFIVFTVLFPLGFVVYEKSNLYSSWRQFLFIYPAIVLLASTGFLYFFEKLKGKYFIWAAVGFFTILSVNPLKYMILNHQYCYIYYNQFVGGLKGAYGNYETDYYYTSQTEASKWLIYYLKEKNITGTVKVKATYSVQWLFRNHPEIETSYFRYEERSQSDWDYAITVSRYISPFQLKNHIWPPKNAVHIIYADQVPLCAVLERRSKDDLYGYNALNEGNNKDAIKYFSKVMMVDDKDEMIFYNFAAALYNDGQYQKADSVLKEGLKINPDFEPVVMYLGNIARSQNNIAEAISYYERVIRADRKYNEAYVGLSELLVNSDLMRARDLLKKCLTMSPRYKPAIIALAGSYRNTNPDIAKKYDELADTIN